jgi:hypothetical protein
LSSLDLICAISAWFSLIFRHKRTLLGGPKPFSGGTNIGAGEALAPPVYMLKKALSHCIQNNFIDRN